MTSSSGRVERVAVVGGGPAGLAVAGALKQKGVSALVLERNDVVGSSWEGHYDRLHLHTVRWASHLPGLRIPRREGRWVPRDGVVGYLRDYVRHHDLNVRLSTSVESIARDGSVWEIETSTGRLLADSVVIATGYNLEPVLPEWPGAGDFSGELIHSSDYRNGSSYRGQDVLVVGAGNSGAEIAVDLVETGARNVWLSVRTGPNIQRRSMAGLPTQVLGMGLRKLPVPVVDKISVLTQRFTIGDLSPYGMPPPARGAYSRALDARIPILDVGLIKALKNGSVRGVPAVASLSEGAAVLADGRRLVVDAIIAATGFRRGLERLVGHLGVLNDKGNPIVHGDTTHPAAPELYFIGYSNPLSGNLREIAIDARRIARVVATRSATATPT